MTTTTLNHTYGIGQEVTTDEIAKFAADYIVADREGDVYRGGECVGDFWGPYTIVAVPQGNVLTDRDDPQIKAGAKVRVVSEYTLIEGYGGDVDEWNISSFRENFECRSDNEVYYVLPDIEADAEIIDALAAADEGEGDRRFYVRQLAAMRNAGLKVELERADG